MNNRTWLYLNGGKVFDPAIYAHGLDWDTPLPDREDATDTQEDVPSETSKQARSWRYIKSVLGGTPALQKAAVKPSRALPPGYVDMRWKGLGFVLDFGLKRSDEGMRWEMEEWRRSGVTPAASVTATARGTTDASHAADSGSNDVQISKDDGKVQGEAEAKGSILSKLSFLGSW